MLILEVQRINGERSGVCVFIGCTYGHKRRLMHRAGEEPGGYSSATDINFNLILSRQNMCLKMEAVKDTWEIDEQPDVSHVSSNAVERNN